MPSKSLRKKMEERRKKLSEKGGNYNIFIFKEGVTRLRHVWLGGEVEPAFEVAYVYLNKELGGFISASTFGERCAFKEAYDKLVASKKDSDLQFAKRIQPKKKFVSPAYRYKDEKGKEIDYDNGVKLALLGTSQYEQMIDLWLEEEKGDFTDPKNGYDLKHKRIGKALDTTYNVMDCSKSPADKKFRGPYDIEAMARELVPSYKESKKLLEQYMNIASTEEDTESDSRDKKKKKKKKNRDL